MRKESVVQLALCLVMCISSHTALSGTATTAAPDQPADINAKSNPIALRIEHDVTTLGSDGVTRQIRYTERMFATQDTVWLARVMPMHSHQPVTVSKVTKAHKHTDLSSATRWVQRQPDGQLRVRLVQPFDRLIVDVPATEYGNISFDGRWAHMRHLLDPDSVKRMTALTDAAAAGTRWYRGGHVNRQVRVLWDEKDQYPRRIESRDALGTSVSTTIVTRETTPAKLPWEDLKGYREKDYADFLD